MSEESVTSPAHHNSSQVENEYPPPYSRKRPREQPQEQDDDDDDGDKDDDVKDDDDGDDDDDEDDDDGDDDDDDDGDGDGDEVELVEVQEEEEEEANQDEEAQPNQEQEEAQTNQEEKETVAASPPPSMNPHTVSGQDAHAKELKDASLAVSAEKGSPARETIMNPHVASGSARLQQGALALNAELGLLNSSDGDAASTPPSPLKRSFKNSSNDDDGSQWKGKVLDGHGDDDDDDGNPRKDLREPTFQGRGRFGDKDITILKAIIDYHSKKGEFPSTDSNDFEDFTKNWLGVDGPETTKGTMESIRRKHEEIVGKIKENLDFLESCTQKGLILPNMIRDTGGQTKCADEQNKHIEEQGRSLIGGQEQEMLRQSLKFGGNNLNGSPRKDSKELLNIQGPESFEDGEIDLLRHILDYYSKRRRYPFIQEIASDDFIKNWLQVEVSRTKMMDDIQRLLEKYQKIVEKMGENLDGLEPRDQEAFELTNKIWGTIVGTQSAGEQSKHVGEERKSVKGGQEQDLSIYPFLRESLNSGNDSTPVLSESIVNEGLKLIESSKLEELYNKWKQLLLDETEFP